MSRKLISTCVLVSAAFCCGSTMAASNSIELSKLVSTFLLSDDSDFGSWFVGKTPDSPIKWKTSGLADGTECNVEDLFCRTGTAVVTINGKVTHKVLAQKARPGQWLITLSGPRAGVNQVTIESDVSSDSLDEMDIPTILDKARIKLTPIKCFKEMASSGNVLYKITAPNKKPAWLLNEWSCGSGGCTRSFSIYYDVESTSDVQCFDSD